MDFSSGFALREQQLVDMFEMTFTQSENGEEGALIGNLVRELLSRTAPDDIHVVFADDGAGLAAALVFSRLSFSADARTVFLMAPVAVIPAHQARGVGKQMIAHGLEMLRQEGVHVVFTYGDPGYYERTGFAPVSEAFAAAPFPLEHPE